MRKNIGALDTVVRLVGGFAIIGIGIAHESWWGTVGFIPSITAAVGWSPLYALLRVSTKKNRLAG